MTYLCAPLEDFLDSFTCTGELTLNDAPMSTKAWTTVHLLPLWVPGNIRGTNLILPQVTGRVPYPHRLDETTHDVPMLFASCWDDDGDPITDPDPMKGLQANVGAFMGSFLGSEDPATGCYDAVLTMPDGTLRGGCAQFGGFRLGDPDPRNGTLYRATLTLILPEGWLFPIAGS